MTYHVDAGYVQKGKVLQKCEPGLVVLKGVP